MAALPLSLMQAKHAELQAAYAELQVVTQQRDAAEGNLARLNQEV